MPVEKRWSSANQKREVRIRPDETCLGSGTVYFSSPSRTSRARGFPQGTRYFGSHEFHRQGSWNPSHIRKETSPCGGDDLRKNPGRASSGGRLTHYYGILTIPFQPRVYMIASSLARLSDTPGTWLGECASIVITACVHICIYNIMECLVLCARSLWHSRLACPCHLSDDISCLLGVRRIGGLSVRDAWNGAPGMRGPSP